MMTLNDGRSELWQWDTKRKLTVDAECSQVHFSNKVFGRSIDMDVVDGVAIIPDILLQTDKDLFAWAFVGTPENGYTKISKVFKVNRRNKPSDYVFTPPEQTTLGEILERLDDLESVKVPDAIKNAVEDYLEQNPVEIPVESVNGKTGKVELTAKDVGAIEVEIDPTVSAWAKQPQKPAYTAQEVGALPDTTKIPSALSELSEDTIHRVVTDAEKAAWNAKSNFSGSYNDLTDKPTIPDVPVQSVNGKTGAVVLSAGDVGAISQDDLQEATKDCAGKVNELKDDIAAILSGTKENARFHLGLYRDENGELCELEEE